MTITAMPPLPSQAIGIIDSGVGGLSVLREIKHQLPNQHLIYIADSAHAPYGEKPFDYIQTRVLTLCDWLFQQNIKALVIACNTATAHAIQLLRTRYPQQLIIGVEPGLKPAQLKSLTGMIGVLATYNTLQSDKFCNLVNTLQQQNPSTRFICQAGTGLVNLIEEGKIDSIESEALLRQYLEPMLQQNIDTLVLGCTHYPFVTNVIRRIVGPHMHLIDTSYAIAQQLYQQLSNKQLLTTSTNFPSLSVIHLLASAMPERLSLMAQYLLNIEVKAHALSI